MIIYNMLSNIIQYKHNQEAENLFNEPPYPFDPMVQAWCTLGRNNGLNSHNRHNIHNGQRSA